MKLGTKLFHSIEHSCV